MSLVPDKITPLTSLEVLNAIVVNFESCGRNPTRRACLLKTAQIHLETGLAKCHCWNPGNIKYVDSMGPADHCMFGCDENVDHDASGKLPAVLVSPHVKIRSTWTNTKTGRLRSNVWISPPHPWSRFRAFDSLVEGAKGQMFYLLRHPTVLDALMTGDPDAYGQALKNAGYYTAPANPALDAQGKVIHPGYKAVLRQRLGIVTRETLGFDWGDVEP